MSEEAQPFSGDTADSAHPEQEKKGLTLSLSGFSVMACWHFLAIFSSVFNINPSGDTGRPVWIQMTLYLALVISYLFIAVSSRKLTKLLFRHGAERWSWANIGIGVIASVATVLAVLSEMAPFAVQIAIYAFLGFSGAMMIFPWLDLPQVREDEGANYRNLAFNMGIGSILAIFIGNLQAPVDIIVVCALPLLSSFLLVAHWNGTKELESDMQRSTERIRRPAYGETIRSSLHFLIFGFVFGLCQGAFSQGANVSFVLGNVWPLLGATISAVIIFCVPGKYIESYGIFTLYRAALIFLFAGLFCVLIFVNPLGSHIGQILFFGGFNVFDFAFMVFAFSWAIKLQSDFAEYIGINRLVLYLGAALGLGVGFLLSVTFASGTNLPLAASGIAIVMLTCTTLPIFDEMVPYAKIDTGAPTLADVAPTQQEDAPTWRWSNRVAKIADEHALSEREREVFFYLAKGRNAAFIQQELWISIHTVKTHISNIYRKLGVHSIQEVLDMVDQEVLENSESDQEGVSSGKE